jgi:hypothetical protein
MAQRNVMMMVADLGSSLPGDALCCCGFVMAGSVAVAVTDLQDCSLGTRAHAVWSTRDVFVIEDAAAL